MHKLLKTALLLISAVVVTPTIAANATNIRVLPLSPASSPTTIAMTDRKSHLLDFTNADRTVTGVWVDDPAEFARSFKVETIASDPRLVAFVGVAGGSSKFTVNLLTVDADGRQYIQPVNLIKRSSEHNITQFVDRTDEQVAIESHERVSGDASEASAAVPNGRLSPTQTNSPTATQSANDEFSPTAESAATAGVATGVAAVLEHGALAAAQMAALTDPELQSRVTELVTAAKSGRDPYQMASSIGISQRYVAKLIDLGKSADSNLETN
jgi:hypothetical protein